MRALVRWVFAAFVQSGTAPDSVFGGFGNNSLVRSSSPTENLFVSRQVP
jgi:hypothetical protein